MDPSPPALLRAYPELEGVLARRPFVTGPTPVEPLALEGWPAGRLWVKRDDRSCPLYGGNKPRKLEWIVGEALGRGSRRLVTTGGLGTHHGLATTILGREAGLATTLVLVRQPPTPEVAESLALDVAYGAELVYGRGVPGAALQVLRVLARAALRGERPTLVPTGGSSARGNVGFVSAALELAQQVKDGALPEPERIVVAVGSGGTLAGLVAGCALAGLGSRVTGVLVSDILPPSPARLAAAARAVLSRLHRLAPRVPALAIAPGDFDIVRDQLGPGYGAATPAGERARALAAGAGLALDPTYTAKAFAHLLACAPAGEGPSGPVLFWNTFNGVDVAATAPRPPDPERLPAAFRRLLSRGGATCGTPWP